MANKLLPRQPEFLCVCGGDEFAIAGSLEEAFKEMNDVGGTNHDVLDCTFYRVVELDVEHRVTIVEKKQ